MEDADQQQLKSRKKGNQNSNVGSGASGARRRNAPPLSSWFRDDLEGGKSILSTDITNFVRIAFESDPYTALLDEPGALGDLLEKTQPEKNRKGARVIWIENIRTGDLVPLVLQPGMAVSSTAAGEGEDENLLPGSEDKDVDDADLFPRPLVGSAHTKNSSTYYTRSIENGEPTDSAHADVTSFIRTVFLLMQGLFAGVSFAPVYLQFSATSDDAFLQSYQSGAQEYRRLCYILASLSLVGTCDALMTLASNSSRGSSERVGNKISARGGDGFWRMFCRAIGDERGWFMGFSLLALFFHFVAFICTIVMSRVDVIISTRNGYGSGDTIITTSSSSGVTTTTTTSTSAWTTLLLANSGFASDFSTWKSLNKLRLVVAVLAWACCCFVVWRDLTTVEKKSTDLRKVRYAVSEWRRRVDVMEGADGLEDLDVPSLKKLVGILQLGLDRAQAALRTLSPLEEAPTTNYILTNNNQFSGTSNGEQDLTPRPQLGEGDIAAASLSHQPSSLMVPPPPLEDAGSVVSSQGPPAESSDPQQPSQ